MPETTEFLPFHAINEFMRPDFRLSVVRDTLNSQASLPEELANDLNHKIKKRISVPGFRNSEKAPPLVKVLPTSKAFEKHPDLVASILACWTQLHSDLRGQVYELLKIRDWKLLSENDGFDLENLSIDLIKQWPIFPLSVDRSKLPGFYTHWPKGEDFEAIYKQFTELNPNSDASIDKVSLMAVWVSMRLPYQIDDVVSQPGETQPIE